ncbi:Pentatricopeptide repeat (PPR) superfamily protein [Melia azedarach]|uniref:Pentatricopeptide repeat (PPR) superfamily protein n=1 Tax=Melia azedarach TaxID=155640 RepID=A0ACC1YI53_MELAZ|nr:Pentatricopeptide repeat (PPR) superfamily protein [Melia azedarach]
MSITAAASSLSLGPSRCHLCHAELISCSASNGITNSWIKNSFDGPRAPDFSGIRNPFFGSNQFHWLSTGRDLCLSKVSVAADYSDSVPDSSNYINDRGYHPLEELKFRKRARDTKLTSAEIARTTVEANNSSLLVFPGTVHCEPHERISWAEFQYVIDDYGDIFFEIFDDENILQDPGANNPVNALIGMDIPVYENQRMAGVQNFSDIGTSDDIPLDEDYFEVVDSEDSDISVDWGMPDTSSWVHPIYFSKCLTKAVHMEYDRKMDHPSNGVSIVGYLRPAFADEETYVRRQFHLEDSDGDNLGWKDGEIPSFSSKSDRSNTGSTLYRLEIMRIELFSVYGVQSTISLQDFQDAEPDILVHSTSAIIEHFSQKGISCNVALKALCKKKGFNVEEANLIGVDSLGMDVRVSLGVEVRTHRFPFKIRAISESAAEKQIQQLLFPRSRRKKLKSHRDMLKDSECF